MTTVRLEAFSDGVLAIAVTLLVLNIQVPAPAGGMSLADGLGHEWPVFVAYLISFLTIGIIWINHHAMIRRLREVDHTILVLNLVVLLTIGVLPFTTALMATYVNQPRGQHLAAAIYSGSFLMMGVAFGLLNRRILFANPRLLGVELDERQRRRILVRGLAGVFPYVLAAALAPVSAYATLAICGAVALFYASPVATGADGAVPTR